MLIMKKIITIPYLITLNKFWILKFFLVEVVFLQFLVQSFMNEWQSLKTSDQH